MIWLVQRTFNIMRQIVSKSILAKQQTRSGLSTSFLILISRFSCYADFHGFTTKKGAAGTLTWLLWGQKQAERFHWRRFKLLLENIWTIWSVQNVSAHWFLRFSRSQKMSGNPFPYSETHSAWEGFPLSESGWDGIGKYEKYRIFILKFSTIRLIWLMWN